MRMRARRHLAALAALAVLSPMLAACSGGGYDVIATFDDVGDLQSRGGVQIADVRVGSIGEIKLTDGFKARVRLHLHKGIKVPRDSQALVRTTSLLGEKFIELRAKGEPTQGPFLRDGDVVTDTGEAPELEFVAQEAVTVLGSITAGDVATLIQTGAEGFGGREAELRSLIEDFTTISATFAEKTKTIQSLIDALDRTTSTLAQGSGDLAALLDNLADTTKVLADNRDRVVNALDKLARLARVQNVSLDKYRLDIDRQIKQLSAIVAVAAQSTGQISSLLDWVDRFFIGLPEIIPGDFTQVYMWAIPCDLDPRETTCPPPQPPVLPVP
ncbi:MAG: phospholipid/cholesterol/gamma-HCH transport system substrate-binding protein [Acidimicrobiaceae bacterium]|nr:phospholipid/cholesterol/gamma-HCH transport system substrate-binding protein [Acidimicrobiaceae bacterium]